jgi:peptidoglycan/xylan/chitin deacetylase (PgdA/CDA1 family)
MSKNTATLSLDLDNQWSYMKTHGDRGWETFPSYLDLVVPRILRFLDARELIITVFVVGQDAALSKNRKAIGAIATAGHEIGNHSFHHEQWMHLQPEEKLDYELSIAEDRIGDVTGKRPVGYRGPGFCISSAVLRVLSHRGYRYDASTLPTFIGPLARAYYFMTAKLSKDARRSRSDLFGGVRDCMRPIAPYRWSLNAGTLVEIPVTTMPLFRIPMHASYLLYLHRFSPWMAKRYLAAALILCRLRGVAPSILLHPLDFLGVDDVPELSFFPAMDVPGEAKMAQLGHFIDMMRSSYHVTGLLDFLNDKLDISTLPRIEPRFGCDEHAGGPTVSTAQA